ncbi:3-phosphoglycerate dehydrogenase [Pontibacillus halophilus JSM 076056 = DSM 19796]|uniref:D-3-phosphoglycerate dehydrogenase n=1 Tax=Pontibacillus halophilus JSM 076056 = DSM 19796 TaxID=1385510 RepID=A0A0A5GFJ3_9BACI|nr:phosphoglycerate dehydrogenase [Pontibacillus halophilus]KGX91981.1 3-phosphoglycerate dehydrogenase [Pontibacillus halophilus JSM 076056 = DSM 19796]
MHNILVSDPISAEGIAALTNRTDLSVDVQTNLSPADLLGVIGKYDALIVRSQTKVTKEIIEAGSQLKVIGRAGVGVDNIDLDAATEKGIIVVNAPDGNTMSTAEHTFAMLMSLSRHIPQAYKSTVEGNWDRKSFKGVELNRKTLGIVGMGRIGTEVSKRAKAFNMDIISYDPFLTEERAEKIGVRKGSLQDIYKEADYITVHTPLTKETHHLIDLEAFQQMKQGVRLINCARGGIIDEDALVEAIDRGIVAGAAIDVFEQEPPERHPLLKRSQVIATPHLGASTEEAQTYVAKDVSEEILHILNNESFKNAVNMPQVPADVRKALEPYYLLGEKIGEMAIQLIQEPPHKVTLTYAGELTDYETESLTRTILKGLLRYHLGSKVNVVNATYMAKSYDLSYSVEYSSSSLDFTNLISVRIETKNETRTLSGTLLSGYGPRIIKIDDYSIDVAPTDHLLYIQHLDTKGMIGHVGTALGEQDINIATMQVGRKDRGGDAIMMITVDKPLPKQVRDQLEAMEHIRSIKEIQLS